MKKIAVCLIACLVLSQSMHAALPPKAESVQEYTTITNALVNDPNFQNIIPVIDSIIDIKRITKKVNILGKIKYKVVTRHPKTTKKYCTVKYIATINVAPNQGIGPHIVTMISLRKAHKHHD